MSEQFQVGRVYATRGGDRVRVEADDPDWGYYRLRGVLITTSEDDESWTLDGRYFRDSRESPHDLLPGALPTPATDDKAELLAALREMLALDAIRAELQRVERYGRDPGQEAYDDFETRSHRCHEAARAAIAKAERT